MYALSEQQIDFILNDIKVRGVEMEDLQSNLLDHICCIIECELETDGDFEKFYQQTISRFFKKELKEIEEETILLLTFKNYYAMKKSMIISGAISVVMLVAGSIFKLMHWPGAGPLLVLGIFISSLVFLPLMAILKNKEISVNQDRLVLILGTVVGILFSNFVLFKVMHWPGANILLFSSLIIGFFIFLPIYFFTGIRKPEARVNTITSSILLVMVFGLQFTLINTRPAYKLLQTKMHLYMQDEDILQKMQVRSSLIKSDSTSAGKLANQINKECEQIKGLILENSIGTSVIPNDFEDKGILMEEGSLGSEFYDNGSGVVLMNNLKDELTKLNIDEIKVKDEMIPINSSILAVESSKRALYSNYTVLNSIVQLQMYVASVERK